MLNWVYHDTANTICTIPFHPPHQPQISRPRALPEADRLRLPPRWIVLNSAGKCSVLVGCLRLEGICLRNHTGASPRYGMHFLKRSARTTGFCEKCRTTMKENEDGTSHEGKCHLLVGRYPMNKREYGCKMKHEKK